MLNITKPKLVFCDDDVVDRMQEALHKTQNNALIFVFGQSVVGTKNVKELLIPTGFEDQFM